MSKSLIGTLFLSLTMSVVSSKLLSSYNSIDKILSSYSIENDPDSNALNFYGMMGYIAYRSEYMEYMYSATHFANTNQANTALHACMM